MPSDKGERAGLATEAVFGAVYAVLLIGMTVVVQNAVRGFLDQFSVYVGGFIVSVFSFIFALIIAGIGKFVLRSAVGKHFLSRYFVIFACVFAVIACAVFHGSLLLWWMTAVLSVFGTIVAFIKKLLMKEVKERVREEVVGVRSDIDRARRLEHDLRHESIRTARGAFDRLRGKR